MTQTQTWTATDLIETPEKITEHKLGRMDAAEIGRLESLLRERAEDERRADADRYRYEMPLDLVIERAAELRRASQSPVYVLAEILESGGGQLDDWGRRVGSDIVSKSERYGLSDKQLALVIQLIQRSAGFIGESGWWGEQAGKSVVDTHPAAIVRRALDAGRVSDRDASFAASLCDQYESRGSLSPKQTYWIEKFAARYAEDQPAEQPVADEKTVSRLFEVFDNAGRHLKFPKITVQTNATRSGRIKFRVCGSRSRTPGAITIDDGRPFGENEWFGTIARTGTWNRSRNVTPEVEKVVQSFIDDPVHAGRAHGLETGGCCFCGRELTDPASLSAGYGPICAENWGLPHGEIDTDRFPSGKNNNDWRTEAATA